MNGDAGGPWRFGLIFFRLQSGIGIQFNRIDSDMLFGSLRQHKCQ
jgi:hypothetical protein